MKKYQFSQIGKRTNNEDSVGSNANIFTVCDGMGGHVSGERASGFVVSNLLEHFANPIEDFNKMVIQEHLDEIQHGLNHILDKEPELEKMGTTFTGIFPTKDVWYAAYIGDSRIYLFRPSERKLWHTWDHSLVGELMRNGEITREAGRHHPLSNRIGKAIIANTADEITKASVFKIDDLREGDIFLLCSDGVVEAWGDHELCALMFDEKVSFEEKGERLQKQCNQNSKDNNTALLVQIEAADAISFGSNDELTWFTEQEILDDYQQYLDKQAEDAEVEVEVKVVETSEPQEAAANKTPATVPNMAPAQRPVEGSGSGKNGSQLKIIYVLIALVLILAGVLFIKFSSGKDKKEPASTEMIDENKQSGRKQESVAPAKRGRKHEKQPDKEQAENKTEENTDSATKENDKQEVVASERAEEAQPMQDGASDEPKTNRPLSEVFSGLNVQDALAGQEPTTGSQATSATADTPSIPEAQTAPDTQATPETQETPQQQTAPEVPDTI